MKTRAERATDRAMRRLEAGTGSAGDVAFAFMREMDVCPDCGRASCTGEGCYWPDDAGIARPAWHGIAATVGLWPEVGEDQPLPFCTCGHSLATHARSGASPCMIHGCPCKAWQLSPGQTGGSDY